MTIYYKIKSASEDDIYAHLNACDPAFNPPLSERVNLSVYCRKIARNAVTFEAWETQHLVGLVAAYFNDLTTFSGFITNVSLLENCKGRGIASELINMCLDYARHHKMQSVHLEVSKGNRPAVYLYEKFGFIRSESGEDDMLLRLDL